MPTRPRPAHDRGGFAGLRRDRRPCFADGRLHQVATGQVGRLEGVGVGRRLDRVACQQQPGSLQRLPHPTGGIEPWGDGERDGLQVHRGRRDPGTFEERGDPRSWRATHPLEAQPGDRPVLADHRCHVGDGADGRQVRELESGRGATGLVGEDELRDLERDATPRQAAVRVGRIGTVRVDDREGRRQDRRDAMVVGDDDVDAAGVALGHLGDAGRAAVDGDDQRRPEGDRGVECRHRQPVALVEPARHVRLHRDAEAAQGEGHDRQPGQPVRIEVTEDEDPLPAIACRAHPQQHARRIREGRRVVQALERVGEPGDQVLRR